MLKQQRQLDEESGRRYLCREPGCGRECVSYHTEMKVTRWIDDKPVEVLGIGLGTWRCMLHGAVKVRCV